MANSKIDSATIFKAIDVLVNKRIEESGLDKTIIATIDSYLGKDGAHRVKYNGGFFTAYAQTDTIYQPKTSVYIQVPQNNFSNRKIILGLASSYYVGNNIQAVSSAINNYSIIGTNILQWANNEIKKQYEKYGFGLNSYTAKNNNLYQDSLLLYDRQHLQNQSVYELNFTRLNTYIKEAKAIMLSADFYTILNQEQQLRQNAEYGLIFNLAFKNKDVVYQTNKELFDAVSDNVKAWSSSGEAFISMKTLQSYVEQDLSNISQSSAYENEDEVIDNAAEALSELQLALTADASEISQFISANDKNFTQQEKNIFESYRFLITDLSIVNYDNKEDLIQHYYDWFDIRLQLLEDSDNEPVKIISYVLDSSNMTGNPFMFNSFINQYAIFPIAEDFQYIDKIAFYCNNFISDDRGWQFVDKNRIKMYDPANEKSTENDVWRGKDIWVKNLQFLALKEISSEYGDYKISIEAPQGAIFYSMSEEETLSLKANIRYKEWTNFTDSCTFYWFVKDNRVSSSQDESYHYYGGIGWRYLNNKLTDKQDSQYTIKASNNKAYENIYLCVAVYDDGSGNPVILKEKIVIYNESCKRNITIQSDIGTKFKFDVGFPTLTCLIDGQEDHFDTIFDDSNFSFYWSKRTSAGNVLAFTQTYDDVIAQIDETDDYNTRLFLQREANQLQGISFINGLNGNKIKYPVRNISDNSEIYFDCQVFLKENDISTYCIGNAEILLHNEGVPTLNEYTVVIENGDQVFQYRESGVSPLFEDTITPTPFRQAMPIEIKELKAHLYDPNGVEVNSGTYKVQWQYPIVDTLILPPEGLYENILTQEFDCIDGLTTTFSIAESFDYQCTNNQIKCIITYGNVSYSAYTHFFFGKIGDNGTNGTDIVAQIQIVNDNTKVLDKQLLTVFTYKNDDNINYKWNIDNNPDNLEDPILEINLRNRSTLIDSEQLIKVRWKILGNNSAAPSCWTFEETEINNQIKLIYDPNFDYDQPNRRIYHNFIVQGSADIKDLDQTYYCYYPICIVETNGTWDDLRAELYSVTGNNRLYIDKNSYLKQILYNADGRTPQYDTKAGVFVHGLQKRYTTWRIAGGLNQTVDINNPENNTIPIRISKDKEDIQGVSIIEGTTDINGVYVIPNSIYNGESCDNRIEITTYSSQEVVQQIENIENEIDSLTEQYNIDIKNYDDQINNIKLEAALKIRAENKTYILQQQQIQNDSQKTSAEIQESLVYLKNLYNNTIVEIEAERDENIAEIEESKQNIINKYNADTREKRIALIDANEKTITITVPIYISLNVFGLASLNAWDGNHIDINEEGGYIVTPQIGAGKKESNNSFTGIVMGEMSQYGNSQSDIGLLGLSQGRQSIFLDSETGNAYFGLPENDKFGSNGTKDYNEGRIELKPGDVSKIGGWRIGRRSLYYTETGDIGPGYDDNYAVNHEKDINHDDVGILLSANNLNGNTLTSNPYISIKGRKLKTTDVSNEAGTNIKENDYLELQLDPMQRSLLSIFVHRKENDVWSRTLLSGIDNKGRFIANRLQNGATGSGTAGSSTSFAVSDVFAFKDTDTANYVGAQFEAGNAVDNTKTFIALFANKSTVNQNNGAIYITGGQHNGNDYSRPLSIHGQTISLYASKSSSNEISTNSKITISGDNAFIGNVTINNNTETITHGMKIPTNGTLTINHTGSSNNGSIDIGGSHELKVGSIYTIQSKGLTVNSGAAAWSISNTSGTGDLTSIGTMTLKSNGAQNIYAYNNNTNKAFLLMSNTRTQLGYQDSANSTDNSYLRITPNSGVKFYSYGNMNLYANHGQISIIQDYNNNGIAIDSYNSNGSNSGSSGHVYMRFYPNSGNSLNLNTQIGSNATTTCNHQIQINTHDGAYIQHSWKIMPGYTTWANSAGWEIKPGIQTNWEKITEDSKKLYFKQHTVSKSRTDWGETSTCDTSGDNLYDLLLGILDEVVYTLNYSKDIYASLTNLKNSLGSAAYANTGDFRPSWWTPSASDVGAMSATATLYTEKSVMYTSQQPYVVVDGQQYTLQGWSSGFVKVS